MTLETAAELSERHHLLVSDGAGSFEHCIDQRGCMAFGEDQVVVARVVRVRIVVPEILAHQNCHQISGR